MNKNTNHQFLIGSWVSFYSFDVDSYEKQLDRMHEAGLNFNIFPNVFGGGMSTPEACDAVEQAYASRNMLYFMNGGLSEEALARGVQLAQDKEHCIGYHLKDEPTGSDLPLMGQFVQAYRSADGKRFPFVNLFPSYVGEATMEGTYYEYCSRFVREAGAENIEYLSHDYYPFQMEDTSLGIFADMEVIRRVAWENGRLRTHAFPQASAWNGMRMPNINEMRWNVYGYLAYGFKALSWFNLVCPGRSDTEGEGFRDSLIYRDGTIRDPQLFEDFGRLNHEILALGDTLMDLDTVHAYHTKADGDGVEIIPDDWMITPVRDSNFVISHMVTRQGDQTYVMIFNKDWANSVTASFRVSDFSGIEGLEYISPFDGNAHSVMVEDGVFTDTFRPGEGKLYRLNGKVSYRVLPFDAIHARAVVDLAVPLAVTGMDILGGIEDCDRSISIKVSTNKRFTEDRTATFTFDAIPENGQLRLDETLGKYIRMTFANENGSPFCGSVEVRVRYADEFAACAGEMEAEASVEAGESVELVSQDEAVVTENTEAAPVDAVYYDVDYTDLDEALAVVDGLNEAEYSEESWQIVKNFYEIAVSMKDGTHPQEDITNAYWQLLDHVRELVPVQWTLPKPEHDSSEEQPKKQNIHVTKGVLPAVMATLAGGVAGILTGIFVSKSKKTKNK